MNSVEGIYFHRQSEIDAVLNNDNNLSMTVLETLVNQIDGSESDILIGEMMFRLKDY